MNVHDKIKLELSHNGIREILPAVPNYIFSINRDADNPIIEIQLNNSLRFHQTDFDFFAGLKNQDLCAKPILIISARATGTEIMRGTIIMGSGNWDHDTKFVEFDVETEDEYTCLKDNKKKEKDILQSGQNQTATILVGSIVNSGNLVCANFTCADPAPGVPMPPPIGSSWTLLKHNGTGPNFITKSSQYVREEYTGSQPPGEGWTNEGGSLWVRAVPVKQVSLSITTDVDGNTDYQLINEVTLPENAIDNGRTLESVFGSFLDGCNLTIQSEYFDINPLGNAPSNIAYDYAALHYKNLLIFKNSDITRSDAGQNATKGLINFDNFWKSLSRLKNIEYWIEGNVFRVEHVSYRNPGQGEDFSDTNYPKVYNYKSLPPIEETWIWPYQASLYFVGSPITYSGCVDSEKTKDRSINWLYTDLEYALDIGIGDRGFFLISTVDFAGKNVIPKITTSGQARFNGALSMPNFHNTQWRHKRLQLQGVMNGQQTTFLSSEGRREQTIPLNKKPTEFADYDFSLLVKTEDWAEIENGSYDSDTGELTMNLLLT